MTAYGVLSRGLIGGGITSFVQGDFRAMSPRFQGENFDHNRDLVAKLEPIATGLGISVGQLAISWVAAQGQDIGPVVGIKNRERLQGAVRAMVATLGTEEPASIGRAVPRDVVRGSATPRLPWHSSTANVQPPRLRPV